MFNFQNLIAMASQAMMKKPATADTLLDSQRCSRGLSCYGSGLEPEELQYL